MAHNSPTQFNCALLPQVLGRACGCPCSRHGDTTLNDEGRNPKRPRYLQACATASFSDTQYAAALANVQFGNYAGVELHTKGSPDVLGHTNYICPSPYPPNIQNYLTFPDACSPQQDFTGSRNIDPVSTIYTATSNTLSPRSFERPLSADPQNSATLSPGNETEHSVVDIDSGEFQGWLYSQSDAQSSGLRGLVISSTSFLDETIQSVGDGFHTYLPQITVQQESRDSTILFPPADGLITNSDDPWSSVNLSFVDGGNKYSDGESFQNVCTSTQASQTLKSHGRRLKPLQTSTKGLRGLKDHKWNNFVIQNGVPRLEPSKNIGKGLGKPPGRRRGPLKRDVAEQASLIRKIGACYQCRLSNLKCSPGDPCKECESKTPSLSNTRICFRARLVDYTNEFSPDLVVLRFMSVGDLLEHNTNGFTENKLDIEVSSGPDYPKINLTVHEFSTSNQEFLSLPYIGTGTSTDDKCHKFTASYALPVGLDDTDSQDVERKFSNHIDSIIERQRDVGEAIHGDTSMLSWEIFEAVNKYRKSCPPNKQDALLVEAIRLHAMHYFMSRLIVFTPESAEHTVSCLQAPRKLAFKPLVTSNVVNLQLKRIMNGMIHVLIKDVLERLDQRLSTSKKDKARWTDTFCTILVLCICIEAVQVASDSSAVAALRKGQPLANSRIEICRRLDDLIFKHLADLFHSTYRSYRTKVGSKSKMGFNPIQWGLLPSEDDGITREMANLVREIRRIKEDHKDDIAGRSKVPSFESKPDLLTHHMAFRKRNSGRLVSKFLKSFTEAL